MSKRIDATGYASDKAAHPHYLRNYEKFFEHLVGKEIRLLELGVDKGGSLLLWRDYFEKGIIVGLDLARVTIEDTSGRVRFYQGHQEDTKLMDHIVAKEAPEGFEALLLSYRQIVV